MTTALSELIAQHDTIRGLMDRCEELADEVDASPAADPGPLTRELARLREAFDAHGVCWGPYQTFRQMVADDARCSTANPLFTEIDQPGVGRVLAAGSPIAPVDLGRVPVAPAPRLGEHTDAVLADVLGLTAAEIGALHDRGVVAGPAR